MSVGRWAYALKENHVDASVPFETKVKVYGNTFGHTKKNLLLRPLFDMLVSFISSPPLASFKSKRYQNEVECHIF